MRSDTYRSLGLVLGCLPLLLAGCRGETVDDGFDDEVGDTTSEESGSSESGESESGESSSSSESSETADGESSETADGESSETADGESSETADGESSETADGESSETADTEESADTETTETETTETTGDDCTDEEIACDGLDEDCNGVVDDLDLEQDGFCDCYKIGIIGTAGANPAANFAAWLEDKGTSATRFGTMPNHVLTEADLADYDVLIVDRLTHVYSPQERQLLADWVAAGHGLISMAGYTNSQIDRDQQNSLVAGLGLTYEAPIYIDPTEVWQNHPVALGAEAVQIYGGWRVVGNGEVFVRPQGEPQNSFGTAVEFGEGAVIVFSDEWISFDSEWQAIPEVPLFWANMIKWVGPKDLCFDPQ